MDSTILLVFQNFSFHHKLIWKSASLSPSQKTSSHPYPHYLHVTLILRTCGQNLESFQYNNNNKHHSVCRHKINFFHRHRVCNFCHKQNSTHNIWVPKLKFSLSLFINHCHQVYSYLQISCKFILFFRVLLLYFNNKFKFFEDPN